MEYILTFIEGFASFISPCILPMIPIYLSYFIGENDNKENIEDENGKKTIASSSRKMIINSIGFVIGFTIVFLLLGRKQNNKIEIGMVIIGINQLI